MFWILRSRWGLKKEGHQTGHLFVFVVCGSHRGDGRFNRGMTKSRRTIKDHKGKAIWNRKFFFIIMHASIPLLPQKTGRLVLTRHVQLARAGLPPFWNLAGHEMLHPYRWKRVVCWMHWSTVCLCWRMQCPTQKKWSHIFWLNFVVVVSDGGWKSRWLYIMECFGWGLGWLLGWFRLGVELFRLGV